MSTKKCRGCGLYKDLDDFYACSRSDDGRQLRCKVCQRAYQERNRDKARERAKQQRERAKASKAPARPKKSKVLGGVGTLFPELEN